MKEIILATRNLGKVLEIKEILSDFSILSFQDLEMPDVLETGTTLEENSLLKAKAIYDLYQKPVIADDSGLLVDALDGEPGVYSARYAGDDKNDRQNILKLLSKLKGVENRKAHFKTVITYYDGSYFQVEGILEGKIALEMRGTAGFGYDPVFLYEGKTLAEHGLEVKNKISHRKIALEKLKEKLDDFR